MGTYVPDDFLVLYFIILSVLTTKKKQNTVHASHPIFFVQ